MRQQKRHILRLLALATAASCVMAVGASAATGTITGGNINVRTGPSTGYQRVGLLRTGNTVEVLGEESGWYHIAFDGREGYVRGEYLLPDAAEAAAPVGEAAPAERAAPAEEAIAVEEAAVPLAADAPVQETYTGTITGGTINIRTGPNTRYDRVTTVTTGKKVEIIGEEDDWYYILIDGKEGYVFGAYLIPDDAESGASGAEAADGERTGVITGGTINVRTGPDTSYSRITLVSTGKRVNILGEEDGWYHVSFGNTEGYVFGEYLTEGGELPASGVGGQIVTQAQRYLGTRYVYGGSSPNGFDCSGFTSYLYAQYGYSLPHSASRQYANCGCKISKSDLQPGDLVFFSSSGSNGRITHVGLYIGNNSVIHARYSLGKVHINSLSEGYYSRNYVGAVRVV